MYSCERSLRLTYRNLGTRTSPQAPIAMHHMKSMRRRICAAKSPSTTGYAGPGANRKRLKRGIVTHPGMTHTYQWAILQLIVLFQVWRSRVAVRRVAENLASIHDNSTSKDRKSSVARQVFSYSIHQCTSTKLHYENWKLACRNIGSICTKLFT